MNRETRELRFAFGKNWKSFVKGISDYAIDESIYRLKSMLGRDDLVGLSFVDVGSGSGLSSLAAMKLGADRVVSFDVDDESVSCTENLRDEIGIPAEQWQVMKGSALEESFIASLGKFDIVYSWGVLHHTGDMWRAIDNVEKLVDESGFLNLALYNDQGFRSRMWHFVKWLYNKLPRLLRPLVFWPAFVRLWGPTTIKDLFKGRPFHTWKSYVQNRGMSPMIDAIDWVGGYPFEVATPERVTTFIEERGYKTTKKETVGKGLGCNEFVFRKEPA